MMDKVFHVYCVKVETAHSSMYVDSLDVRILQTPIVNFYELI